MHVLRRGVPGDRGGVMIKRIVRTGNLRKFHLSLLFCGVGAFVNGGTVILVVVGCFG